MNNQKDLCCVVFNYNNGIYIKKCLESIFQQKTQYTFHVLIIDDCSTDNSKKIVSDFKKKKKLNNLYFYSVKKNTGLGKFAAQKLKRVIKNYLNTKYFYRIDSDDFIIDEKKFEKQITLLENYEDLIAVSHRYKFLKEESGVTYLGEKVKTGLLTPKFLIKNLIFNRYNTYNHTSTYLFRNIFKKINPPQFEYLFFIRGDVLYNFCFLNYGPIFVLDDIMSIYRIHKSGVYSSLELKKKIQFSKRLNFYTFLILNVKNKLYFLKMLYKKHLLPLFK